MSEKLLKVILQLLAIVAKEDDVTSDEILSIKKFLEEHVNRADANKYLEYFNARIEELAANRGTSIDEKEQIISLTKKVNQELTKQQKLVVMIDLMELIVADGSISERESELVYFIGECFNFSKNVVNHIRSFVVNTKREKFAADSVLIVDSGDTDIKARHLHVKEMPGFLAFFRIPMLEAYFVKYVGTASLTLNGLPLRRNRVWVFPHGSTIKGNTNTSVYFSDVVSSFRKDSHESNISFVAENLSYKFPNGNVGLVDVNIAEASGKLIGIMGGSGAGKSTLFNVLNGNDQPAAGSVRINGSDIHKDKSAIEGLIGYVPQDDLLIEDLTVHQNLYYAAKLCFDSASDDELNDLVNKTLSALGLMERRDLKVGNPLQKTISGGQRKRLNIGLELLREPAVMFVDEPTSGLSSRDSENIMDLLKELSLKGKMVFVVIHQPSSVIFKMFDKLLILDVGGYQIYYGNPIDAVTYFKSIVDMIDKDLGSCIECGNVNPEQIFNIIETKVVDEYGQFTDARKISAEEWYSYFQEHIKIESIQEVEEAPEKTLKIPNKLKQIGVFVTRDVLSKLSNRQYLIINLLQAPMLAFLLAFIVRYSQAGEEYTFRENLNIPAFFFMSVIVSLFMGLTISAEEIIRDRRILKREAFLNLSRLSYLLSKTGILFFMSALQTFMFVLIGNYILEIRDMGVEYFLVLFSISCFANILGLNISSAFNSAVTIYILIPILIIPQLILSGVVVGFDKLHPSLTSEDKVPLIGEMMASRWAYEALAVNQFKHNPYEEEFYELDRAIAEGEFKTIYLIPFLEADLDYCHHHLNTKDPAVREQMTDKLNLVRDELNKELSFIGKDKFPQVDNITVDKFDGHLFEETIEFLKVLKKFHNNRRNKATSDKDKMIAKISRSPEEKAALLAKRDAYQNETIIRILKNTNTDTRIIEEDGHLIRKVYPIYARDEFPSSPLDFRVNFYYPEKHFLGIYFDTLSFNVTIIWIMTVLLFITLYFDMLRRVVSGKD